MIFTPCCITSRRHFARKSNTEREGVSSMYRGAFSRAETLENSRCHSSSLICPFLNFSDEIPVSEAIIRVMSCTDAISRENNASGISCCTAMFLAMESRKAVLPIAGRAAMMMRSEFCQPPVSLSISLKPDGIPEIPSLSFSDLIVSMACFTREFAVSNPFFMVPFVISKKLCSALSRSSKTSVDSLYELSITLADTLIRLRRMNFSRMTRT